MDEPVAERVADERLEIAWHDVIAATDHRERATRRDQADRAARARAERDVVGNVGEPVLRPLPGRARDIDGPAAPRRVDIDRADLLLQLLQVIE